MPRAPRYANYDGKFDQAEDQAWVADVLTLNLTKRPDRWRFRGKCSRCDHEIDIALEVRSGQARPGAAAPPGALSTYVRRPKERTVEETVACNCKEAHGDRPKEEKGCGIYGKVSLQLERA